MEGSAAVAEGNDEDSASESGSYTETDFSGSEGEREPSAGGRADAAFSGGDGEGEGEGSAAPRRRGGPGSIASTYWRPERTDRKNLLTVLDERCQPFPHALTQTYTTATIGLGH